LLFDRRIPRFLNGGVCQKHELLLSKQVYTVTD
jgi:hypothetical protein